MMIPWSERDVLRLAGDVERAAAGHRRVEDVLTRTVLCLAQVDEPEWLGVLREPVLALQEAVAPNDDPGTLATGVTHATVRLLTDLGDVVSVETATKLAQARVDALTKAIEDQLPAGRASGGQVAVLSDDQVEEIRARSSDKEEAWRPIEQLAVRWTTGREDRFAVDLAVALAWIDPGALREVIGRPAAANVMAIRQKALARAAAEVDRWCGGEPYPPGTDAIGLPDFNRLVAAAWILLSCPANQRRVLDAQPLEGWMRDLLTVANQAIRLALQAIWAPGQRSLGLWWRENGRPLAALPDSHPLHLAAEHVIRFRLSRRGRPVLLPAPTKP